VYPEYGTGKYYSITRIHLFAETIRINAAIKTQLAAGGLKGALLKKAVDAKLENWRTTGQVTHRVYDALVFRKVSAVPSTSATIPWSHG
jgi:hypothetical protein